LNKTGKLILPVAGKEDPLPGGFLLEEKWTY